MKRILLIALFIFLAVVLIFATSFLTDKNEFGQWIIKNKSPDSSGISWAKFKWDNEEIGSKYYQKTSMQIPAKVKGLPYNFLFQLDLGASTVIYENSIRSIFTNYPGLNKIEKLKSPLQFWNKQNALKNFSITFSNISATTPNCRIEKGFGNNFSLNNSDDSSEFSLGTIGADLFQNKILIIDYPNERFAVCDTLPPALNTSFINIEIDKTGRVILPLSLGGKTYKVIFDTGSSMFQLLVTDDKINNFSSEQGTDTIQISSWGKLHNVIGRPMKDRFVLGGKKFANINVYADYRKESRTNEYDAITGNALFWNNVVIVDFKNKKFGVR
jgi:hypothetical protein